MGVQVRVVYLLHSHAIWILDVKKKKKMQNEHDFYLFILLYERAEFVQYYDTV